MGKLIKTYNTLHRSHQVYIDDHNLCEEGIGGLNGDPDVAVHRVDDVAELGVHL